MTGQIRIVHSGKTVAATDGKDAARIVQTALDRDWYKANAATLAAKETSK